MKRVIGDDFLQGPIPWKWIRVAGNLEGKTLHATIAIWMISGLKKGADTFRLEKKWFVQLGISRQARYRALQRLETAGLLRMDGKIGRDPIITIARETT